MVLSKTRITKTLIRLRRSAGWSAPVLFANPQIHVFSRRCPNKLLVLRNSKTFKQSEFFCETYRQPSLVPLSYLVAHIVRIPNQLAAKFSCLPHGLQSRPPSPKRAERKVRRRPFREAGSGQNNGTR